MRTNGTAEAMPTFVGIDLGTTNSAGASQYIWPARGHPQSGWTEYHAIGGVLSGRTRRWSGKRPKSGRGWATRRSPVFQAPHGQSPLSASVSRKDLLRRRICRQSVLSRLKEDAEARLDDTVDRAVITVPAYFADPHARRRSRPARPPVSTSCELSTSQPPPLWLTVFKKPTSMKRS